MFSNLAAWCRSLIQRIRQLLTTLFGPNGFGVDELHLFAGLALVAAGFWWLPDLQIRSGAMLAPGAVLVWISVPMRAPFVKKQAAIHPRRRERV